MKKHLLCLLPVVVMLGCVKEIAREDSSVEPVFRILTDDEARLLAERKMSVKFAFDEIDRIVADVVDLLESSAGAGSETGPDAETFPPATRATGEPAASPLPRRTVAAIRPLVAKAPALRSTRTSRATRDTIFHVVDFADERGYCVIAADRRLPEEIVSFVEHGSFPDTRSDTRTPSGRRIENPGLALMMDAAHAWALRSLERHETWRDSVSTALLSRTGAASLDELDGFASSTRVLAQPYEPSWHFHRRIGPLLPVEWSQRSPFNMTVVENTPWHNTPVGCVALAAVQVMAYWKYPTRFHGLAGDRIDWDEIRRWTGPNWERENRYRDWDGPMSAAPDSTKRLVADILWHVGNDIGMNYGSSNSTAYTSRVTRLLAEHGFPEARIVSYSGDIVRESIEARRPVMIDGASHRAGNGLYHANAHAWVIDGYLEQRWWDAFIIDRHRYEIEKFRGFFHNNFGWGGDDNGWYSCGMFDANNGPTYQSDTRAIEWEGESYNYQFMRTIYVDIYK